MECGTEWTRNGVLLDGAWPAVDDFLFFISCTTCEARLRVHNEEAIGAILTCPKCGSMVQVVPPPGWESEGKSASGLPEPGSMADTVPDPIEPPVLSNPPTLGGPPPLGAPPALDRTAGLERPAPRAVEEARRRGWVLWPPARGASPPALHDTPGETDADTTAAAARATATATAPPPLPGREAAAAGPPPVPDPNNPDTWALSPAGRTPLEWVLKKWLLLAGTPVAGLVVLLGVWSALAPDRPVEPGPEPPVVDGGDPAVDPAPAVGRPRFEPTPLRLDRRWLPDATRLVVSLRMSALAKLEQFAALRSAGESLWDPSIGRVMNAFGLKPGAVRQLNWTSTDLGDWADSAVVVIRLHESQDASGFTQLGEEVDLRLGEVACRRLTEGDWTHPYAILDEQTIITGREDLLRGLADRTEDHLQSGPLDQLLADLGPEADLMFAVDLTAARQAGWELPTKLLDVWPSGRGPWHVAWVVPQGLALVYRQDHAVTAELALVCEGQTAADQVQAALAELVPAGREALANAAESLPGQVEAGEVPADAADSYGVLLRRGQVALRAARWEVVERTVWMRVDWERSIGELIAAALDSLPATRRAWFEAARQADEARHQRLLAALLKYEGAEGSFPPGAGGGAMLSPDTRLSWIATLLPYLDHGDWYAELDFQHSWNSTRNRRVAQRRLDAAINAAVGIDETEAGFPVTHYVGVAGVGPEAGTLKVGDPRAGVFGYNRRTRVEDIADGAANTIAILGVSDRLGPWASGGGATVRGLTQRPYVNGPDGFGSGLPHGMLAGMADGSVRYISGDIDPVVLEQLATASGGEDTTVAALGPRRPVRPEVPPEVRPEEPQPEEPADPLGMDHHPEPEPEPEEPPKEPAEEPAEEPLPPPEAVEPAEIDVEARLAEKLPKIELPGIPLVEAIDVLEQLSGVRIALDADALQDAGVDFHEPVQAELADATIGDVLKAVLTEHKLTYVVQDQQVVVTSTLKAEGELKRYSLSVVDLTGKDRAAVAELAGLVQRLVAPESWQPAGGRGSIQPTDEALFVKAAMPVQYQVLTFCEKLRSARGRPLQSKLPRERVSLDTNLDAAREKLAHKVSANFHDPTPLGRIVSFLEEAGGLTILIDWAALGDEGMLMQIDATLQVRDEPLADALAKLLWPVGLTYRAIDARTLEVTTRKAAAAELELEFYRVGDLVSAGLKPDVLAERVKGSVAGGTWSDAGGPGVLHYDGPSKCLIVLQSQEAQGMVQALLAKLRPQRKP